jgi:hypothetical protein
MFLCTFIEMFSPSLILEKALDLLIHESKKPRHWTIQLGGLMILKYFIPLHFELAFSKRCEIITESINYSLMSPIDDICRTACDVVLAMALGLQKIFPEGSSSSQAGKIASDQDFLHIL